MSQIGDLATAVEQAKNAKRRGFGFYVYVLYRADGRPFYVGKGQNNRIKQHALYAAYSDSPVSRTIRKIWRLGGAVSYLLDSVHANEKSSLDREVELILLIGRRKNGGPLVNLTDGGEGVSGLNFPQHSREKMSANRKAFFKTEDGKALAKRVADKNRGKKHSDEHKSKIVAKLTGRPCSEETRRKIGSANSGRTLSAERRAEISESLRGKSHSLATRIKMSRRLVEIDGVAKTLCELASESSLPMRLIRTRINRGWDPKRAITTRPNRKLEVGHL